ncbi:hypothetical protein [Butyrivibrio sp. VCD2006]|nr:hypothetical protein [Butyrivibrio sp. VCD2006]
MQREKACNYRKLVTREGLFAPTSASNHKTLPAGVYLPALLGRYVDRSR